MKGKTQSGFEFEIDERIKTDWRITDAIADSQSDDNMKKIMAGKRLSELLLGKEDMDRLIKHVADLNDGFVPTEKIMEELTDIIKFDGKETEEEPSRAKKS